MGNKQTNPVFIYRRAAGLSLRALAEKWETSFATLSRIESGTQLIPENLLATVERDTGVPAKELRPDLVERNERLSEILGEAAQ